jgi:hypothetical protein
MVLFDDEKPVSRPEPSGAELRLVVSMVGMVRGLLVLVVVMQQGLRVQQTAGKPIVL